MPPINDYKCNKCGYSLQSGWGGHMYVIDDSGERIGCPHQLEMFIVLEVLGENASKKDIKARTGFNSYCVCLSCLRQFELDIGDDEKANMWRYYYKAKKRRDERRCPHCKSNSLKTVFELIGESCPKCKKGTIEEIETGIMS